MRAGQRKVRWTQSESVRHSKTPPNNVEFVPENYCAPLDLDKVFSRRAPLEIDVGSGAGAFLVAMTQRFPTRNFLGLERMLGRIRKSCGAISRHGLSNVRILRIESTYAVRYMLPPESVTIFHVAFPDPWPKRRHWPRRLINDEFLDAIVAALAPSGELRLKTDDAPYFTHMRAAIAKREDFREIEWPDDPAYPETNFERTFRMAGLPIYRLRLVKV